VLKEINLIYGGFGVLDYQWVGLVKEGGWWGLDGVTRGPGIVKGQGIIMGSIGVTEKSTTEEWKTPWVGGV